MPKIIANAALCLMASFLALPMALGVAGSVRPTVELLLERIARKSDAKFWDRVTKERSRSIEGRFAGWMSALGRCCSLIPGHVVKLSKMILAGPIVLSAVGARPPHDGVR